MREEAEEYDRASVQTDFAARTSGCPGRRVSSRRGRAEDERQLSAGIMSAIQVGLYVWELEDPDDPAGMRLVYANPAAAAATGVPVEAAVGRTMREVLPAVVETETPAVFAEVALGGEARCRGNVVYGGDARISERTFSVWIFPLGQRRVGVAFNDVTRAEIAEARLLGILESMSDAFFTLDRDWRYTYINAEGARLVQRTSEELLGRKMLDVFPEAAESKFYAAYERCFRDQVVVEVDEHYEPLDTWFAARVYPTPEGLAVYYRNITDQQKLAAQLLQAQKLAAVGEVAGGVAHNFNNLLTVIDGYASRAQSELGSASPSMGDALEEIRRASARATSLTAKLLASARKQKLQVTVADMSKIVCSALDLVQPLIGAHIEVHRLLDPDAGRVAVDVAQIEQVIVNLATNARDAMPEGGNLYIATRAVELDADSGSTPKPGRYVCLTVRDDGRGMDKQTLTQIFDPFFSTKPVDKGTGLGLSIVYASISQSGGQIEATSTPDEGTTFTIYLPRYAEPVSQKPAAGILPTASGRGERILLVDDNDIVRRLIVMVLTSNAYDVVEARNAHEALALCAGGRFDLMVTDIVMPDGNGYELARDAVALQPHMPVLYISGYQPDTLTQIDIEGIETTFLPKPFNNDQITQAVRDLLDRTPV
jgi:PAS domain S-box-containing protein